MYCTLHLERQPVLESVTVELPAEVMDVAGPVTVVLGQDLVPGLARNCAEVDFPELHENLVREQWRDVEGHLDVTAWVGRVIVECLWQGKRPAHDNECCWVYSGSCRVCSECWCYRSECPAWYLSCRFGSRKQVQSSKSISRIRMTSAMFFM